MKKYRVTVNGTVYEVELEELTGSAPVSAPAAPAAAPAPAASAAPAAGEQICAPMPGNILAVNVTAGQAVKKGDVLMVLEAMKMENEIMCPRDGVVASVNTSKGASVESGTASLLADLHSQGVAENVLAPYIQQLMTAAQTTFSPEMVEQAIAAVTEEAGAAITALEAQLQALVQAEQAAAYYGMTLSDITITPGLVDILYLGVKLGIYPCLIFMGVGAMTDFGPLIANPKSLLLGAAAQLGIFITFVGCRFMGFTGPESSAIGIIGGADGPTAIFVTVLLAPALLGPIAPSPWRHIPTWPWSP